MNAVTAFADPVPLAVAHPHIRFQAVTKTWPATASSARVTALDTVTLDVAEGSITGIIGRSGAGKSTLLRAINGLERPTSGTVEVDGVDVAGLDRAGLIALRRRIGMIFQHFNLLSSRTVFDNVALPLEFAGLPKAEIAERVGRLIDLVGLADKRDRYPAELSGGQKQRVGIARALATEPKVLLSDEATSALDPETTRSILALLKRVNALTGVTIVLITHEMQVIREICDQVAVIDQGRIVEQGPVYRVFAAPQAEITRSLISSVSGVVLPASVASRLTQDRTGVRDAVVRIVFTGSNATAPILSRLSRSLDIDVNVLAGQVDEIGGQPFGQLIVSVPAREPVLGALTGLIQAHGLTAEVIGYVP